MIKLLVLADDFTGALDTGVQFSKQGVITEVTTDIDINFSEETDIEVLVIDTESRYLSYQESYQLHLNIIKRAKKSGIHYYYKKIDSALRGNVSSDIAALMTSFPKERISLIPAYPEINRVVKKGILYIEGKQVTESRFADDPYEPVLESDILKRLHDEAGIVAKLISNPQDEIGDYSIGLFDSETSEEIHSIGQLLKEKNLLNITVGCASFAKELSSLLFKKKAIEFQEIKSPLLVMCGSVNQTTQNQITFAQENGHFRHSLDANQLLIDSYWNTNEGKKEFDNIKTLLNPLQIAIFETFSSKTSKNILRFQKNFGIQTFEVRQKIGQSLGELSKKLFSSEIDRTYLFTGGDTLFQSMQVIGITRIRPNFEYSPGVVVSTIYWQGKEYQVLTKSGGFGEENLFVEIQNDYLKKGEKYVN
ncbi:four-carbon acid sugar kinase family protein [Streptococcus thoraltensis]